MKKHILGQVNQEPSFPIHWLTLIMIFELLMIGFSVWLIGYTEVRVREGMKRQVRLERLHGDIGHLDEVLTMSARMAAESGDEKWEQRYLRFEPLLDEKIQDVMAEAKVLELDLAELGISTTNDANSRLVSMEKKAFELVRNSEAAKARELLSSDTYGENKKLYAQGLEKLLARLDTLVASLVVSQKNQVQVAQAVSLLGWIMLIAVWVALLRGIRVWRSTLLQTQSELAVYQTELEKRVYSMAKQLTRAEHQERQRIAGLLHDQLQQLLVASRLQLSLMPESGAREQVNQLLGQSIKLSRSLTNELNPPGLMIGGFGHAIKWLADWANDNHGLSIELEIPAELPNVDTETKVIAFDAIREILFNVSKHAQTDTASISATVSESGNLAIVVEDKGIGFDPELMWSGECFGLLSTSRRLELIGGFLDVQSRVGRGTKAIISIPYESILADQDVKEAPKNPSGKTKVLIVDDHPVVRAGLVSALRRVPGIELREAAGMSDVRDTLAVFQPDVAIVDIFLGEGEPDGCEITSYLRSQPHRIKVVAFTSYEDPINREKMSVAGASHYLVKGCSTSDLVDAIQS